MENNPKRRRITETEDLISLDSLPSMFLKFILHYLTLKDVKNLSLVNVVLNLKVAELMKERTYLYIKKPNAKELKEILNTKTKFSEIFFHGKQENAIVEAILKQFRNKFRKLNFGKSDLSFMNVQSTDIMNWLNYVSDNLEVLKTQNIEIKEFVSAKITLDKLKFLKCSSDFLQVLNAPNIEEIKIFITNDFKETSLRHINDFLQMSHKIKKFTFIMHCGLDVDVKNIDFHVNHLKLTHLKITSFRFNPKSVLKMLESQKYLVKLHLEDGNINRDDHDFRINLPCIFNEILNLKNLNKLIIELPSAGFLQKLSNLPNLKRLSIRTITVQSLEILINIKNSNLTALAVEGIDFFEKTLRTEDIISISQNYPNLISFKIDTAPFSVVDCILRKMENLKNFKILHNYSLPRKIKIIDNNVHFPQTQLEKIVCIQDDFYLKILPLVKVSPNLKHLKIYWNNKNTAIMTICFEVIEICRNINLIEFKYDGEFTRHDTINKSNFNFLFMNVNYQMTFCRKNGKIKCRRF